MNAPPKGDPKESTSGFTKRIDAQVLRKLKAKRRAHHGVWLGLGMVGLIGWSVALPTVVGALVGAWLDEQHPGKHSWTLALLVAGLLIGIFNAGRWIAKEEQTIREQERDHDE